MRREAARAHVGASAIKAHGTRVTTHGASGETTRTHHGSRMHTATKMGATTEMRTTAEVRTTTTEVCTAAAAGVHTSAMLCEKGSRESRGRQN